MKQYRAQDWLGETENINVQKNCVQNSESPHTHDFIELVYIYAGSGRHCIGGKNYGVSKGNLLFINYNQTHSFHVDGEMTYINFLLKPEFMSAELLNSETIFEIFRLSLFDEFQSEFENEPPIVRFEGREIIEIENIIEVMLDEINGKKMGYRSILKGYMQVVFAMLLRKLKSQGGEHTASRYLGNITPEILKYIDDNYREHLTLSELAEKCFYNPSYFSRIFKACFGRTFKAYIQEKRIAEASRLLLETSLSIEEIGSRVGYADKKQFYKTFRELTGNTPNAMRTGKK